ncbi:MAG: DAK2 domain-containing protein [Anaerolineales bacterium]|nr:DAK2 domain-containing protein [Anaerolineales bacterium]
MTDQGVPEGVIQSPCLQMDGQGFKQLVRAALSWLQHHQAAINALNVYPLPDGDTGTNMVLTMQSAWSEIEALQDQNVGRVARQMAHGALMGARGNSGVILSQIWRGLARGLDEMEVCRSHELVTACQEAVATAYRGVVKPVEGTILTVSRAVADAAKQAAANEDMVYILEHMVFAAHEAVVLTPSLLPVLKEAGVVDAGGQGLFVILEGMLRFLRGEPTAVEAALGETLDLVSAKPDVHEGQYGYDVQFLIVGDSLDVDDIRQQIIDMGDSALVVGDPTIVKVHVHVTDPGQPMSFAAPLGSLRDVVVEDMQAQYQEFVAEQRIATQTAQIDAPIAVVAVAAGEGLKLVFESLGAAAVIEGGQTMNPSTKDILQAIESIPCDQVILLPNNDNIILTAEQATALSEKTVAVVPTATIPQGIAALLALNAQADMETNLETMKAAMAEIQTGEVTTATRSARLNGLEIEEGQVIGLHNGELTVADTTVEEVVQRLLRHMQTDEAEIITLYYGDSVTEDEAAKLADAVRSEWPDQEVEVVGGGQPNYHYILSVE